ncbi:MAG: prolipoprotein diacylglyceryl transferase [Sulfurospirillaceae bacterium]|nr:prolipoprotein diacylglyceryl transferase [Sulfurospirillaceae bacterium]
MEFWNNIYSQFNPIAFSLGSIKVHWYGMMYVLALLSALFAAKYFAKKDNMGISESVLDSYFIWVEIGVILGARIGYILFYDSHLSYYMTHPWQMFNPFMDGTFVGIRGMSYHGAVFGFVLATWLFWLKKRVNVWGLLDLVAISVPIGYVFGRIGNFLNKELVGRHTDIPWGIYVDGIFRHPSQLYEALLEGVVVFVLLYMYRRFKKFDGELIALYGFLYAIARFIAEFWREPDFQIGFVYGGWMSRGQSLSLLMALVSIALYVVLLKLKKREKSPF